MNGRREALRRALIWLWVLAFFAAMAGVMIANGDATALVGFVAFPVVGAVILTVRPAQRVVDAFGERLRSGTEPAGTAGDLTDAVDRALQPAAVGVWTAVQR